MDINDILPKQDDPQRLLALNGVPKPFWLSAIEINLILDVLAALLGNTSALYKDEHIDLQYLEAAYPLPEPGSYAQIIVEGGDNLKASWDNTDKKWFLDGVFILPGTNAAYLLKSVYDSNSDGIIDKAAAIQAVLTAGGTKYYGTKNGTVGVFDFPQLGGTVTPAPTELFIFTPNWQGGLTFLAFAVWVKDGITYNDTREITLPPADGALDRFDLFVIDLTLDRIGIKVGTPGNPAVEPSYNPILFLGASFVSVKAGAISPEGITSIDMWTEGAEWATTGAGADFDVANIESPASGTYAIKVVSPLIASQSLPFIPPAPVLWENGMGVSYKIKNITGGDYRWLIGGLKSNGKAGSVWINPPLNYSTSSLVYQPLSVIIPSGLETITKISLVANVNGLEYFLDDVQLVTGGGNLTAGGATTDYVDFQDEQIYQYIIDLILQGDWAENRYPTVVDMLVDQASQTLNQFQFVRSAIQDTSVLSGWAAYELNATKTGAIANYRKLTYKETFDLATGATATLAAANAYADSLVIGGGSWKENEYPTITELLANQASQNVGKLQHVIDASIDITVETAGSWATYELLGAKTAALEDYRKLSEKESMDVAGGGTVDTSNLAKLDSENNFDSKQNLAQELVVGPNFTTTKDKIVLQYESGAGTANVYHALKLFGGNTFGGWNVYLNIYANSGELLMQIGRPSITLKKPTTIDSSLIVTGNFTAQGPASFSGLIAPTGIHLTSLTDGMIFSDGSGLTIPSTGTPRTLKIAAKLGPGAGWTSAIEMWVDQTSTGGEKKAIEIIGGTIPTIKANGNFVPQSLNLSNLGSYADDAAASAGGVAVGFGYVNSATGAVHRRLT